MAPGAIESGGGVQIDYAAAMFGMATEAGELVVAREVMHRAAVHQAAVIGDVVAAVRVDVRDIAMAGDAAIARRTVPWLMA